MAGVFLLAAALIGSVAAPSAQDDTTVEARVDAPRIGEGDSVRLTIEVRGTKPGPMEDPDLSGLADFTIASGPNVSTSTSMIWSGGQASSTTSKQFTYVLFPRRRGTLTIPTISVRMGSRIRQTSPINIEVVEGRLLQRPPPRSPGPAIGPRRPARQPAGEVMVEAQMDKREAFVGEQVLLTYKVYTQLQLVELPAPQRLPSYTGFWVEEIPVDPRASIHRATRGGQEFIELTLMKKALFPTTSGDLEIAETIFGMPVKVESNDPFDSIFFTPTTTLFRKTIPLRIKVKPLPESGRPATFTGAVGRFTLKAETDRQELQMGEAVGLKVSLEGTGNIRTISEPALPPLPDYKKYAPKVEEAEERKQDLVGGRKTWEYVLTPLAPGPQEIPPITFAYFDPARGHYVEGSTAPIRVTVSRGTGAPAMAGPEPAARRREVTAFGRDVRYIKPATALAMRGTPYHRSALFATLLAAPALLNAALVVLTRRRRHQLAHAHLVRGRRAPAFARRRMKEARRLLAGARAREFHEEVARAITGYIGDSLNAPPAGLTRERIDALLETRGVSPALRSDLLRCLERCDYAQFAPVAPGAESMKEVLEQAEQILVRLRRPLSGGPRAAGAALLAACLLLAPQGGVRADGVDDQAMKLFAEGNDHYAAERFEQAAEVYRQLVNQGFRSEAIHYNLGNALYRSGALGPAILEYERAYALAPNDPDLRANLELARSLIADRTSGAQTTSFFVERALSLTTLDQDAAALTALYLLVSAFVTARATATGGAVRRAALWGIAALALPLAVCATGFAIKLHRVATTTHAIVLEQRLDVRSGPSDEDTALFTVHEGLKVRVRHTQGAWLQVSLENGLNGWVPSSAVGIF